MKPRSSQQQAERQVRDREAAGYTQGYRHDKGAWWDALESELVMRAARVRPGMRVLDAGSGVGRVATRLAALGAKVEAVDFSIESLRLLSRASAKSPTIHPVAVDLAVGLPFSAGVVDAVVTVQVVQHIPWREQRLRAWREMARVCKPGAGLGVVVYNARHGTAVDGFFSNNVSFHRYATSELARELRDAGWESVSLSAWYHIDWPAVPEWIPPLAERTLAWAHVGDDRATYLIAGARRRTEDHVAS